VREFDTTFIVQPEISEEGREALLQRLRGVLERAGATPLEVDDMGKKKLAYEIRKFQKGHYLALMYLDTGKAVSELERSLRLDESILRFLTVRKEDQVEDVEARKARAVDLEKTRKERAAERAVREAEERAAREAARAAGETVEEPSYDDDEDEEPVYERRRGRDDDDDRSPAGDED
jgi:small subunit ribosomal protein S6